MSLRYVVIVRAVFVAADASV